MKTWNKSTKVKLCKTCGKLPRRKWSDKCNICHVYTNNKRGLSHLNKDRRKWARYRAYRIIANAKMKGLAYSTLDELSSKIFNAAPICPYLGITLEYKIQSSRGHKTDNAATVDRVDSTKGYTVDNIVVCSWRANYLKANGTLEEFQRLIRSWEKLMGL